jgi:hypothetical protein
LHTIRAVDADDQSIDSASATSALRGHFTRLMFDLCDRFKREIDYNPTRFREMVSEHGGPEAARRLLHGRHVQTGLETLAWHGRLAESVEAHVLQPRFADCSQTMTVVSRGSALRILASTSTPTFEA